MKYFDHAATTPPYEDVIRTVGEVMAQHFGNPSSLHRMGEDSGKLLSKAREVCAHALQVNPGKSCLRREPRRATIWQSGAQWPGTASVEIIS